MRSGAVDLQHALCLLPTRKGVRVDALPEFASKPHISPGAGRHEALLNVGRRVVER